MEYKKEEVEIVVVYKSASVKSGGIPLSPMEYSFYARVKLKNNATT
jgi:hypothetical protein